MYMITFFRRHLHSNVYKIIGGITFISLSIGVGLPTLFKQGAGNSWIARVNGHIIGYNEFTRRVETKQAQLDMTRYQFQQMGLPFDLSMLRITPEQLAFKSLIEDTLLDEIVRHMHFILDEEYIAYRMSDPYYMMQELSEFVSPYIAMNMRELTADSLNRVLRSKNLTIADFENFVENDLKRKIVKDITSASAYIPEFELRDKFTQDYIAKKFSAIVFSLDDILQDIKKTALDEAEVKQHFDAQNSRSKHYMIPEKRSGKLWEFTPENYGIKVSDDEIHAYYNTNKMKYQEKPAQLKVRHILFKLTDPSQAAVVMQKADAVRQELVASPHLFATKAEELSDDKETAKKGGVIEYFAKGDLKNPTFEQASFVLKADGDISPVVQTSSGLEIIQRVDRKPAQFKKQHTVHHEIKEHLLMQKFKHQFDQDVESITSADIHSFVKDKNGHEKIMKDVQLDDSPLHQKLFKIKSKGEVAGLKHDAKGYLIQLTDLHKAYVPGFDSVRSKVENDIYMTKAKQALIERLNAAKVAAHTKKLEEVAELYHGVIKRIGWVKPDDEKHIKQLTKEDLPTSQMLPLETKGAVVSHVTKHGAYLIQLDDLGKFDNEVFNAKKPELYQELQQRNSMLVANSFIASLSRGATIETNEKAVQTSSDDLER